MLKKLVFVVVVIIFAGPAYQFVKDTYLQFNGEQAIDELVTSTNGLIDQSINTVQQVVDLPTINDSRQGSYKAANPTELEQIFLEALNDPLMMDKVGYNKL